MMIYWTFMAAFGLLCGGFGFLVGRATVKRGPPKYRDPYAEGKHANEMKWNSDACPYVEGSLSRLSWMQGWVGVPRSRKDEDNLKRY